MIRPMTSCRRLAPLAIGAAIVLATLIAPLQAAPEITITNVVAENRVLDRGDRDGTIEWRYRLGADGKVSASLYDSRNVLVRRLVDGQALRAGDQRLTWDGTDDLGRLVPVGFYVLTIEARTADGRELYDPTDQTGGTLVRPSGEAYDLERQGLLYTLPEHALVRVHLGLVGGLLLRTPVDWVVRAAGEHFEPWDGKDESLVLDFGSSPQLDIQVWAYSLPINAVVVQDPRAAELATVLPASLHGNAAVAPTERSEFLSFDADRERRAPTRERKLEMYNHWTQDRGIARNPKIYLSAPKDWPRHGEAVLVDKPVGLRLHAVEEDEAFLLAERFETVVYLDGSFVFEEEQGYLPFTWRLRPEILPPGEHIVTFMIRGYDGHFGSGSIKVFRPDDQAPIAQQATQPGNRATK